MRSLDPGLEAYSAGIEPASGVQGNAVKVMTEKGLDMNAHYPKGVDGFKYKNFYFAVTVCASALESCLDFTGPLWHRRHIGFDDTAEAAGCEAEVLGEFSRIRDRIMGSFSELHKSLLNVKVKLYE